MIRTWGKLLKASQDFKPKSSKENNAMTNFFCMLLYD